jgi:hypothetical protein
VSWKHGATVSLRDAIAAVLQLQLQLSAPPSPNALGDSPQILQLWYESALTTANASQGAIRSFAGTTSFEGRTVGWKSALDENALMAMLRGGGRLLIRAHVGTLFDEAKRPYSAALDAIRGTESLRLPGGVFESWFLVAR